MIKGALKMKTPTCDIANLSAEQVKELKEFEQNFISKFGSDICLIAYHTK
jgi:hypothetical protein